MYVFYFVLDSILRLFHATRKLQLSLHDQRLYNKIVHLTKMSRQLRERKDSLQEKLKQVEKLYHSGFTETIEDMPDVMKNFFLSNITNFKKDKYNRRYSVNDKAFALALEKRSPKLYKFLVNIFCLPSVETLRKFVQNIPIQCGISESLFETLKERAQNFKDDREKYCVLL